VAVLSLTVSALRRPLSRSVTRQAQRWSWRSMTSTRRDATYQAVLDKFGSVAPFSNIVQSEATHIAALERLFNAYGCLSAGYVCGQCPAPATLKDAALTGVEARESECGDVRWLPDYVQEPDVRAVFAQLRNASQAKHLPAFQNALSRNTNTGLLYLGPRWSAKTLTWPNGHQQLNSSAGRPISNGDRPALYS